MKSNREILVSFYNGKADNISRGTKLDIVPLYDILFNNGGLSGIDRTLPKGSSGSIFAYVQNELGLNEDRTNFSDGIIFIDIDKMSKTDIKKIYDNFELISGKLPNTLSCWFSNSYYNQERDYGGLHFVMKVSNEETPYEEYKYFVGFYGMILARVIYLHTGIDIRPNEGVGLDKVTKSLAQRFFLNYSEVKWNDNAYAIDPQIDEVEKEELKKWVNEFGNWVNKVSDYKVVECNVRDYDLTPNGIKTAFGYADRITLLNTLANIGVDHDERVKFMLSICDGTGFKNGLTAFKENIIQCSRTAEHQKVDNNIIARGIRMLKNLGYNIDAEIITNYQPIDYKLDDVFGEVWESEKDKPTNNIYYNPKNVLNINLGENEFISDHQLEINEFIKKYTATYMKGDAGDGKTTHALNSSFEAQLFGNEFVILVEGDSIDLCVPYNSVADNKAKSNRADIKRVMTANIADFSDDKRNVFIWNTIVPLYEQYFKSGIVKRMVLFFDESHKIVTDDYRWKTVFEMFKALPTMYKHFVFMTGTPAYEHEFIKQYFPDMGFINITKKSKYSKECNILKYDAFGVADMVELIKNKVDSGYLPLVYTNYRNKLWREALDTINKERLEYGLNPLRILDYSRSNSINEEVKTANKINSIKDYDIVIGTKYLSVGIDFIKDDDRMRCAIIDYAGETDCTFHDVWQFQARNREQDVVIDIIALDNEDYYKKLYNKDFYKQLFIDMAKVHAYTLKKEDVESDEDDWIFVNKLYNDKKFGRFVIDKKKVDGKEIITNWFEDEKNVTLLGIHYLYIKMFSNMNMIKHMMKLRGVNISEIEMEHIKGEKSDNTVKKEIYKFFLEEDNWNEIGKIVANIGKFESKCYQIDINSKNKENITDGKIWVRDTKYMNWLIKNFAGKDEWREILLEYDFINNNIFANYNRMKRVSKILTDNNLNKIRKFMNKNSRTEEKISAFAMELLKAHYSDLNLDYEAVGDKLKIQDIIDDYVNILEFVIENVDYIEEIKRAETDIEAFKACDKMRIAMEIKLQAKKNKKISDKMKKELVLKDGRKTLKFDSYADAAAHFGMTKSTFSRQIKDEKSLLRSKIQVIQS